MPLCSEVPLHQLTLHFSDVPDNLAILSMVRQGWEIFMMGFLSPGSPVVPPHRLPGIPALVRLCSVLSPVLPLSCTSSVVQRLLKWKMLFRQLWQASAQAPSVRMCLSLPNTATPVQTRRVWRLLASTSCSFPSQLWATWPRTSRLEYGPSPGWMCGCFQIASVSTFSMCSFSPDQHGCVADVSGGPPTALHPPPSRHAHIDTRMCTPSHVHFLALFQQAENKKVGTSGLICRDRIPELISHQRLIHLPVLSSKHNDSLFASNKSNKKKKIKIENSWTMLFFSCLFFFFFAPNITPISEWGYVHNLEIKTIQTNNMSSSVLLPAAIIPNVWPQIRGSSNLYKYDSGAESYFQQKRLPNHVRNLWGWEQAKIEICSGSNGIA